MSLSPEICRLKDRATGECDLPSMQIREAETANTQKERRKE